MLYLNPSPQTDVYWLSAVFSILYYIALVIPVEILFKEFQFSGTLLNDSEVTTFISGSIILNEHGSISNRFKAIIWLF